MQLLCNKPKGEEKLVGGDEGGVEQDEEEEKLLEEVEEDRLEEEPEPEPPQLVSFSVSTLVDTTSLSKHCPITQNWTLQNPLHEFLGLLQNPLQGIFGFLRNPLHGFLGYVQLTAARIH